MKKYEHTQQGEVVVAITELADNFLRSVIKSSKDISKHRGGKTLEVRDVALHLKNEWDITIPVRFFCFHTIALLTNRIVTCTDDRDIRVCKEPE